MEKELMNLLISKTDEFIRCWNIWVSDPKANEEYVQELGRAANLWNYFHDGNHGTTFLSLEDMDYLFGVRDQVLDNE